MPKPHLQFSNIKTKILVLATLVIAFVFNNCSSNERFDKLPEGRLEFDIIAGYSNSSKDSIYLKFELHIEGLFNSIANFNKEIYTDSVVFNLGDFSASHAEGAQPHETFSHGTKIPTKVNGDYKIVFNRPHRKDSAIISFRDSFFAMKSLSHQIYFAHDTIRKIFPNTYWVKVYNCNCSDTVRIVEVDQEMKAAGCIPIELSPGNYEHFRVTKDGSPQQAYGSNCHCEEVRLYEFAGDRQKIIDFYNRLRAYYNYKIYMDIKAWDGWSVR